MAVVASWQSLKRSSEKAEILRGISGLLVEAKLGYWGSIGRGGWVSKGHFDGFETCVKLMTWAGAWDDECG